MVGQIGELWTGLRAGGIFIYPLLALGVLALGCGIDRLYIFTRYVRPPRALIEPLARSAFDPGELRRALETAPRHNAMVQFFTAILDNEGQPIWWIENAAADRASLIERRLDQGLWILETIVTAAPLLGLLGTIAGMIGAFRLFGASSALDPASVTGGVAEALINTGLGIVIALLALAAYNYFGHRRAVVLDEMERLGTQVIDHIRLGRENSR